MLKCIEHIKCVSHQESIVQVENLPIQRTPTAICIVHGQCKCHRPHGIALVYAGLAPQDLALAIQRAMVRITKPQPIVCRRKVLIGPR
jgi:hypothetical protein